MIRIRDLALSPGESEERLAALASRALGAQVRELRIRKKSVDARKGAVKLIYTVDVSCPDEGAVLALRGGGSVSAAAEPSYAPPLPSRLPDSRPVVAGFGPAGMFAALLLAEAGLRPIVLERGGDMASRRAAVERFWLTGELDARSNVQFGEGGAGTFSDGKLTTGTKDSRIPWVLDALRRFGAPEDILTDAHPHIGTDMLPAVVTALRSRIVALGGDVRFNTALTGLIRENGALTGVETDGGTVRCERLILSVGHSARDTFHMLLDSGIAMERKPFSMGVRIEHLQADIDAAQYGRLAGHPALPPAEYKLNCRLPGGESAYTFCMCPGGAVVSAASEAGGIVTNGMSVHARDGKNANSALLVTLLPEDFPGRGALAGALWQRELEQRAGVLTGGGYLAPVSTAGALLGRGAAVFSRVEPSIRPGTAPIDMKKLLPEKICSTLAASLPLLGRKLRGFDAPDAVLTGPETRSSSPVRMPRDESRQSVSLRGLWPCGEGAGWAGGIMSAAVDGLRCAEELIKTC